MARLPDGATWSELYSVGWLGGIGFTVAIFVAGLAFAEDPLLPSIKAGILVASVVSAMGGWLTLLVTMPATRRA